MRLPQGATHISRPWLPAELASPGSVLSQRTGLVAKIAGKDELLFRNLRKKAV
jgi:hypothetical protein